jgi:hypothetical protein
VSGRGSAAPEVSVYIQTYQHREYVRQAIEGVLAQRTPFEVEIVVADDCSTDGTRELLAEYRDRHPDRIRLLLPERNLGPAEIFRRSVGDLQGRYVAWLDGDDYWTDEDKLVKQVEALRGNPGWAACFHNATILQEDEENGRPYVLDLGGDSVGFADLLRSNHIPSLSFMARGEHVRGLPGWVWGTLWTDWMAVLAISLRGEIGYLPETMGVYRRHGKGISSGLSRAGQLEADMRFFAELEAVAGEEHRTELAAIIRERHCQLVVERLDLPFSGAVAVLGPRGETPTELNGRPVWPLAIEEEELAEIDGRDRDGRLGRQLEGFRLAAPGAQPGLAHFPEGDRVPEASGEPALRLLVVGQMLEWLRERSRLGRQLEGNAESLWEDETCALYEVSFGADAPLPMGALAEVTEAEQDPAAGTLFGGHLDQPAVGKTADAHAVEVSGWVVGETAEAVAVEVLHGETLLVRTPVGLPRPDLVQAFPERPGIEPAGFSTLVSLIGRDPATAVEVVAVLDDDARIPLARLTWDLSWRSAEEAKATPLVSVVLPEDASEEDREDILNDVRAQTYAKLEVVTNADAASGQIVVALEAGEQLAPRALEIKVAAFAEARASP